MNGRVAYDGQLGFFDPDGFTEPVRLVGLGGLGNPIAFLLTSMGLASELHLYDFDVVEGKNVPCQLTYCSDDIGKPKVEAAADFLERYRHPRLTIVQHAEKVTADTPLEGIVIGAVDNMAARHGIWEAVQANSGLIPWYIDCRMGGMLIQIFTVDPNELKDVDFYASWLFGDDQAAPLPCAERTLIGPPVVLAGVVTTQFTRLSLGHAPKRMIEMHVGASQLFAHDREDGRN